MADEVLSIKKTSEGLLSKRRQRIVSDPLDESNPITTQVLGICSALAVTIKLEPSIVMSLSVVFVLIFSNLIISAIRKLIPSRIRIIVQLSIVASLVALIDQVLRAYMYDISKVIGVYVGLIITNCIIMGRLEAFAMGNKPYDSILDGFGSGIGYAWVLLVIAFFRELFGSGSLLGFKIFETFNIPFTANGLMTSSIGAFLLLGIIIWIQRSINGYKEES